MRKRSKRWPIWRIAGAGVLCVVAAVCLFCASVYLDKLGIAETGQQDYTSMLTFPLFLLMLGMGMCMLAVIFFIKLGLRIKEARTPPWERKSKSKRRR